MVEQDASVAQLQLLQYHAANLEGVARGALRTQNAHPIPPHGNPPNALN